MQDIGILWIAPFAEVASYLRGLSEYATYLLDGKPETVTQGGVALTPYQSWDGTWCVDGKRGTPLSVDYPVLAEGK